MPDFCHLHCHTQYSLLDGAARIKRLVGRASEMEMSALAITDHGNLYGAPEFYTTAKKAGIDPILGTEFYLCADHADRTDRVRYHQVLLAKNEEGYRNLIKLSSLSYTDGYYYKPRIDRALLKKYSAGLVATTCCLQGEVLQAILKKSEEEARKIFESYLDIFGDDYYIEIQDHAIPEQRKCNAVLLKWAKEYNVKVVATNDVHYVDQADSKAQDVLLCLQTGKSLDDPNRMKFENDQFYLKSGAEMRSSFAQGFHDMGIDLSVLDAALDGTREIADKCTLELQMGTLLMPHFPIPPQFNDDPDLYLRHLTFDKARARYGAGTGTIPEEARERIDFELSVIKAMGYAGYFLIVQDFTTAARDLGVSVGPGRGSAAGSAVAYCLGITNVDPLKYDLLFERFLNPERVSMPDIDIDFDDRGRGKVIDYVVEKYGRESRLPDRDVRHDGLEKRAPRRGARARRAALRGRPHREARPGRRQGVAGGRQGAGAGVRQALRPPRPRHPPDDAVRDGARGLGAPHGRPRGRRHHRPRRRVGLRAHRHSEAASPAPPTPSSRSTTASGSRTSASSKWTFWASKRSPSWTTRSRLSKRTTA